MLYNSRTSQAREKYKTCPGVAVPVVLQQVAPSGLVTKVNQVIAFPCPSVSDMGARQVADPIIAEVLVFWRRKLLPTLEERKKLSRLAVILLRQWDRLVETEGVLYQLMLHLVAPALIKS